MDRRRIYDLLRQAKALGFKAEKLGGYRIRLQAPPKLEAQYPIGFCPVTAAVFIETGEYFQPQQFLTAAARIELSEKNAHCLAAAADARNANEHYHAGVRRTLEKVLGLI